MAVFSIQAPHPPASAGHGTSRQLRHRPMQQGHGGELHEVAPQPRRAECCRNNDPTHANDTPRGAAQVHDPLAAALDLKLDHALDAGRNTGVLGQSLRHLRHGAAKTGRGHRFARRSAARIAPRASHLKHRHNGIVGGTGSAAGAGWVSATARTSTKKMATAGSTPSTLTSTAADAIAATPIGLSRHARCRLSLPDARCSQTSTRWVRAGAEQPVQLGQQSSKAGQS